MNRIRLSMLCLVLTAVCVSSLADKAAAQSDNPKEILAKAEAALKKINLVSYQGQYKGLGWVADYVPTVEGAAMLGEPSKYDIPRFRCDVRLTPPHSQDTLELTAGCDGDQYYFVDPKTKTVYADMDEAVLGSHSRNVQRVLMRDFVIKEPLAEDLKAEKVELKDSTAVGDEMCYQINVVRSETQEVTWFISQKDWLPRRVDRLYKDPQRGEGSTQLVVTNLVAKPTFKVAPFKVTVPDGFSLTDEFAP